MISKHQLTKNYVIPAQAGIYPANIDSGMTDFFYYNFLLN